MEGLLDDTLKVRTPRGFANVYTTTSERQLTINCCLCQSSWFIAFDFIFPTHFPILWLRHIHQALPMKEIADLLQGFSKTNDVLIFSPHFENVFWHSF